MIRDYGKEDLERVLAVWYRASRIAHPFLSDEFLEREREQIAEVWLPQAETWVYEHAGEVVGFIALVGNEVGGIFVDPASQGKGIGRALMDHAVGLRGHLELEVFEDNRIGRRFYERYGFEELASVVDQASGLPALRLGYRRPGSE